jgi:glycogen(starch) synthase
MRVLLVAPGFPPMIGGGERYAHALAQQLAQAGHTLTVVTSDARAESDFWRTSRPQATSEAQEGPLRVIRCPCRGLPGGRAALLAWRKAMVLLSALPGDQSPALMQMARRVPSIVGLRDALASLGEACDVVHGFNLSWEHPLLEGWRMARARGLPFMITPFTHLGAYPNDRVARNASMDHQRRILLDADAVLVLTAIERDGLLAWGVDPARVHVVGAGLDAFPEANQAASADVLAAWGLSAPIIAFVGRTSGDKGAIHAAEAVRLLRARGTLATLALVGQAAPEFLRYYRRLPLEQRTCIRLLGAVDDVKKHALLEACHMLVLPSRTESFGLVFLEAWAHGKPVIGARAGGIPGVVSDGEDGLLTPYGDVAALAEAMGALLADPALAERLGRRGEEKLSRQFSWAQVGARVLEVYQSVIRA